MATIGGDHACHVLRRLDWDLIERNPKIVIGFSDITVLTNAIHRETGLVTFNGPSLMTDWAEFPEMPEYARQSALGVLCNAQAFGRILPSSTWTEEFLDWETGEDELRSRSQNVNTGWTWIGEGVTEGPLIGGCIESLQHLRGTRWWPDLTGAVLLVETSEDSLSPARLDSQLMDLENMGEFEKLSGLIVAKPYAYSEQDRLVMHDVVRRRLAKWSIPILVDVDAGHTSPIVTLPLGCRVQLDSAVDGFEIMESAVS